MSVILDANAAIEVVLSGPKSEKFNAILNGSDEVISSSFFMIETANVLRKYYHAKQLNLEEARVSLNRAINLVNTFVPIETDYLEAMNEAIRLQYSAYDMLYLILARRYNATLLTLDGPLNQIAQKERVEIVP
jgi:predicted nucleic acid-binding protein